jgi:hypothetical protein
MVNIHTAALAPLSLYIYSFPYHLHVKERGAGASEKGGKGRQTARETGGYIRESRSMSCWVPAYIEYYCKEPKGLLYSLLYTEYRI